MAKIINFSEEKKARILMETTKLEFKVFAVVNDNENNFVSEEILGGFQCKNIEAFEAFSYFLPRCMTYLIDKYARSKFGLPLIELRSVKEKNGKFICVIFELQREEIDIGGITYIKLTPEIVSVEKK